MSDKVLNVRIGSVSKLLTPGIGACTRCCTTWRFVEHHNTQFSQHESVFPLCELCWLELTPIERLPYYLMLLLDNADYFASDEEVIAIIVAVLAGK